MWYYIAHAVAWVVINAAYIAPALVVLIAWLEWRNR